MTANSFPDNVLEEIQMLEADAKSWQGIDTKTVASDGIGENARKSEHGRRESVANSSRDNGMQTSGACASDSDLRNVLAVNDLRGSEAAKGDHETEKSRPSSIAPGTLMRWCKFNLVGGMGIAVQFAALFLLKTVLHFNYLAATAIAVEAAVVHNFVWHEQFTWADRTKIDRTNVDRTKSQRIHSRWRRSLTRLMRFNLTTGAVSILGNLALMKLMVGQGHMNYLLANAVAIILCSLANFLVSEAWVFQQE
jgi:putative flippase GtrA